jgi:hypothetical protein
MWGALLRGLSFLPAIGKGAVNWVKNHKILSTVGGLGTVAVGASLLSDEENKQPEQTNQQTTQQNQTQQQTKKQTTKSSKKSRTINFQPLESLFPQQGSNITNTSQSPQQLEEGELSQITNQIQSLFLELDKYRQMYEALSQQYLQANEIYEKQLLQTMQTIPFLLAKTPLNNMTNEDLIQHANQLFTSMPYSEALEYFPKITKGYYLAKANGVDPSSLSTTDLVMIAENPVLAKSVDENIAQFLEQIGEILKFKIKSNMDKIGALRDQYQNVLKELEEKAKLYKSLIDAYKFEMKLDFDISKFNETMRHKWAELGERQRYHNQSLALKKESLELKKQKQSEKANKETDIDKLFPKPKENK